MPGDIPPCDLCGHSWHGLDCKAIARGKYGSQGICTCRGPFAEQTPVENEGPKTTSSKGKW